MKLYEYVDEVIDTFIAKGIDPEMFENEMAASLLLREVLFINEFDISRNDKTYGSTSVLFVNLSDTFAWGVSDAENVNSDEIYDLYKTVRQFTDRGEDVWAARKRRVRPQDAIRDQMKESGEWPDDLDKFKTYEEMNRET